MALTLVLAARCRSPERSPVALLASVVTISFFSSIRRAFSSENSEDAGGSSSRGMSQVVFVKSGKERCVSLELLESWPPRHRPRRRPSLFLLSV